MHRAGAAQRHAASEFGAVQAGGLANRPQQRHIRVNVQGGVLAVQYKANRHADSRKHRSTSRILLSQNSFKPPKPRAGGRESRPSDTGAMRNPAIMRQANDGAGES